MILNPTADIKAESIWSVCFKYSLSARYLVRTNWIGPVAISVNAKVYTIVMLIIENFFPDKNRLLIIPINDKQSIDKIHGPEVIIDAKIYAFAFFRNDSFSINFSNLNPMPANFSPIMQPVFFRHIYDKYFYSCLLHQLHYNLISPFLCLFLSAHFEVLYFCRV